MKITFIGGGNMADALIGGLLRKGFRPADLRAVEINAETRARLNQKYGVECFENARSGLRENDVVVFAVKPQQMRDAARALGLAPNANLVISIAAGITLTHLSQWLGGHKKLVRAMPNTPALIGEGITGLFALDVTLEQKSQAETILGAVGPVVWIEHEAQMDAVTAISGSGPAYVFYFLEALEEAARDLGLPPGTARNLALHTFKGAAQLALGSAEALSLLRARVTSKGGTTERAIAAMEEAKVKEAIVRAVHAAAKRSKELGDEFGT